MALGLGLGVLLVLLVLSGLNAVRAISQLQSNNETILREFLKRAARLDQLRSSIYVSGTYVRDYLLEDDSTKAEQSRAALVEVRQQIGRISPLTSPESDPSSAVLYSNLQREIQEYWRTLDPVLTWTARQRHVGGYRFLHDEVLPRRSSSLSIADTIASVNQQQLMERDDRLLEMFSSLRSQVGGGVLVMLICGIALALGTAFHILRLESQTLGHLKEVTAARQELKGLSARLVDSQEKERKSLSRELHDAVGQSMSAVQFELHDLKTAMADYPQPLRTRVDRIRELVEGSVGMVRNMALLLRPSALDDLGLMAALRSHTRQVSLSTGVQMEIADALPEGLPEEHNICIFRIVQEALNNVCRHAHARSVEITLIAIDDRISAVIRDDGRGFRMGPRSGLGLIGMQERAESLGGTLSVTSELGKGTTVEASLPLPHSVAAGQKHSIG